ncbi:MAG: hypothetical protein ACREDR_22185 [Blastocatellia bacterium]
MSICELCRQFEDAKCNFGLRLPQRMSCRHFEPGIEKFCANPTDFVSAGQILQMASYFGLKGAEMKKIKQMATTAEENRLDSGREAPPFLDPQKSVESI